MGISLRVFSVAVVVLLGVTGVVAQRQPAPRQIPRPIPTGYAFDTPGLTKPTLSTLPMPFYPAAAIGRKVEGSLELKIVVGADGTVVWAEVGKSLDKTYGVDEQAMFAISKWVFKPGTLKGAPVAVAMTIQLGFRLPGMVGLTGRTP